MMNLAELTDGPELTIAIGDTEYSFSELPVASMAKLQAWVNKNTPHPLDVLKGHLDGLPEAVAIGIAEKARQEAKNWPPRMGTREGTKALLDPDAGQKETLFVALQVHQPTVTRQEAEAIFQQLESDMREVHREVKRGGQLPGGSTPVARIFSVIFGNGDPDRAVEDGLPKASGIGSNPANGSRSIGV